MIANEVKIEYRVGSVRISVFAPGASVALSIEGTQELIALLEDAAAGADTETDWKPHGSVFGAQE